MRHPVAVTCACCGGSAWWWAYVWHWRLCRDCLRGCGDGTCETWKRIEAEESPQ